MSGVRVLVAVLILLYAAKAPAQAPDNQPGSSLLSGRGIGLGLNFATYAKINVFRDPRVQEELQLTDAQKKSVERLNEDNGRVRRQLTDRYRSRLQALGEDPDPQTLAVLREELREALDAAGPGALERWEAGLRKILDKRQATRLDQIHYQTEGPVAFNRPEIQRRLNLSPEQIEQISAIVAEGKRRLAAASRLPTEVFPADPRSLSPEQRLAKTETKGYKDAVAKIQGTAVEIRSAVIQSIAKLLTRRQRENYQKMVGEPFDFTKTWASAKSEETRSEPSKTSRANNRDGSSEL